MSDTYQILRSLDPYHARVGYLGALASIGTRGLDRQDALMARYHELLYRRIFPDDPRFDVLMARVAPDRRNELLKRRFRPEAEDPSAAFSDAPPQNAPPPADWLLTGKSKRPAPAKAVQTEWLYISEFWLHDAVMPSALGYLPKEKADRTLDLARRTSVLLPTLELSETGYLLQHFLNKAASQEAAGPDTFNPLNPAAHTCLPLLYFRILLRHEMLFPFLVLELVERNAADLFTRGKNGLLLSAVNRMLSTIGEVSDPDHVNELRNLTDFQTSISPPKDSTQENYLRPRLEILVDLGFLGRRNVTHKKRTDFMWEPTERTGALAKEMRALAVATNRIRDYLDGECFESWSRISGDRHRPVVSDQQRLLWFARAFQEIGREFGFTPGRTLALRACLMAWENGWIMEVADVFKTVYGAVNSRFADFLRFSGGSRFDSEFLIRLDDQLLPELERLEAASEPELGGTV